MPVPLDILRQLPTITDATAERIRTGKATGGDAQSVDRVRRAILEQKIRAGDKPVGPAFPWSVFVLDARELGEAMQTNFGRS